MRRLDRESKISPRAMGVIVLALLLVLAGGVVLVLALTGSSARKPVAEGGRGSEFEGAAFPPGIAATPFTLTDSEGRAVSLSSYRGRVVVLAFLEAGCVPVCMLIGQQIRGALDELSRSVPVLVVSVDPDRDTPARISAFLRQVSLSGRVLYLTGPPAAIASVWRDYRVVTPSAGQSAFEERAPVYLIGPEGDERVLYQQEELTPEGLAHDIRKLEAG